MAQITNRQIAKTLRDEGGNVTSAAAKLGKKRTALAMRIIRNARLKAILDESREVFLDDVESVFRANCMDPAPQFLPARIFFLKTQGRSRGYIERSEVELSGPGGGPVVTELVIEHQRPAVRVIQDDTPALEDSAPDGGEHTTERGDTEPEGQEKGLPRAPDPIPLDPLTTVLPSPTTYVSYAPYP